MKAAELITELKRMPQDAEVFANYDGALRTSVDLVWLSRSGVVALGEFGDPVYNDEDRPTDAPSDSDEIYWCLPEK